MRTENGPHAAAFARAAASGGLLGLLFFLALYGYRILLPGETGWLLHGDPAQHYFGWAFFQAEPWRLPPGVLTGFGHPIATSVVFTDSIPLIALPLKAILGGLGAAGQYFGAWMLLCYVLLGACSSRLLARIGATPAAAAIGTLLVLTSPALALRAYGHESLMAHWLIVAALERYAAGWKSSAWVLLLLLAVLIHAYWVVILAPLALAALWQSEPAGNRSRTAMIFFVALSPLMAVAAWAAGYFPGAPQQLAAEGYGNYSANLLTWFDPMDWKGFLQHYGRDTADKGEWSRLLPPLGQSTAGQYEGFSYLGAGVLALAALAPALAARRFRSLRAPAIPPLAPLLVAAGALFIAGLSNRVGLGHTELFAIPLPEDLTRLLATFRSSGRFVWPATYLLVFAAIALVCRNAPRFAVVILGTALAVQAYDLSGKWREFRQQFWKPAGWSSALEPLAWQTALEGAKHLVVLPADAGSDAWIPWAELALKNHMTINLGYAARADTAAAREWERGFLASLRRGDLAPDAAAVLLRPGDAEALAPLAASGRLRTYRIGGYWVVRSAAPAPLTALPERR